MTHPHENNITKQFQYWHRQHHLDTPHKTTTTWSSLYFIQVHRHISKKNKQHYFIPCSEAGMQPQTQRKVLLFDFRHRTNQLPNSSSFLGRAFHLFFLFFDFLLRTKQLLQFHGEWKWPCWVGADNGWGWDGGNNEKAWGGWKKTGLFLSIGIHGST